MYIGGGSIIRILFIATFHIAYVSVIVAKSEKMDEWDATQDNHTGKYVTPEMLMHDETTISTKTHPCFQDDHVVTVTENCSISVIAKGAFSAFTKARVSFGTYCCCITMTS